MKTTAVTPDDKTLSPIEGCAGEAQPFSQAFWWHSQSGVSAGLRFVTDAGVQPPRAARGSSSVDRTFPSASRVTFLTFS